MTTTCHALSGLSPGRSDRSPARPSTPTCAGSPLRTGSVPMRCAPTSPADSDVAFHCPSPGCPFSLTCPSTPCAVHFPGPHRCMMSKPAARPVSPDGRDDAGRASRLCAFARGSTETVWCWKYPESVICLRHRRWVSSLSADDQPDLNGQPDIIRAHLPGICGWYAAWAGTLLPPDTHRPGRYARTG